MKPRTLRKQTKHKSSTKNRLKHHLARRKAKEEPVSSYFSERVEERKWEK